MTALDWPDAGRFPSFRSPRLLRPAPQPPAPRLDLRLDADARTLWCRMAPGTRRALTPGLLDEMAQAYAGLREDPSAAGEAPLFLALDGEPEGAFGLGLDLQGLAGLIRLGDREALRAYLSAYAGVLHGTAEALGLPLVTLALLRGDAMGAGLELALSCDLVVAERGARFGFPDALIGLPDAGASLVVARRIGLDQARAIVGSGRVYAAEELFELGLVDVLAEPGEGEAAAKELIAKVTRRHNAQAAVYRVKRRVLPIGREEVQDLADAWVEAALALGPAARRTLDRLAAAQRGTGPAFADEPRSDLSVFG